MYQKCLFSANVITSPLCKYIFSRFSWRWPIFVWYFCIESYQSILIKSCIYGSANICTSSCTPLRPIYIIHTAMYIEDPWTNSFQMIFWDKNSKYLAQEMYNFICVWQLQDQFDKLDHNRSYWWRGQLTVFVTKLLPSWSKTRNSFEINLTIE